MGRPTDNPKNTMFRVRLDDDTLEKLQKSADKLKLSKSDVVRQGIELMYGKLEH